MLRRILNVGERETYRVASEIASVHNCEVFPKLRLADLLPIDGSGINDELFSFALKSHLDVVIAEQNMPVFGIEFDGEGHQKDNDWKKNQLCEIFGLPLLRISMRHLNERNFRQSSVAFFIHHYFAVQDFLLNGRDAYDIYDPTFYITVPGLEMQWPFAYAPRWRQRLKRRLASEADRFKSELADLYRHGLVQFAAYESTWIKEAEIRTLSGMKVADTEYVFGQAWLTCEIFGFDERTRECFLRYHPFVEGLAAGRMYEKMTAWLNGDVGQASSIADIRSEEAKWEEHGFSLWRGVNWQYDKGLR